MYALLSGRIDDNDDDHDHNDAVDDDDAEDTAGDHPGHWLLGSINSFSCNTPFQDPTLSIHIFNTLTFQHTLSNNTTIKHTLSTHLLHISYG